VLFTAERLGGTEKEVKRKVKIFLGKGKTVGFAQENGGKIFERGTPGEVKNRFLRRGNEGITSRTLKAATKAAMRHAWRSRAKCGTKLRPDTYRERNCRRLQAI
jgi:hypothetical protein